MSEEDEVEPSQLGTKEYWDAHYACELANFHDGGDEGDVWFGERAENLALSFICREYAERAPRVVDVGAGNGHFLRKLRSKLRCSRLLGLDYSAVAVQLARDVEEARRAAEKQTEKEGEGAETQIEYEAFDVLAASYAATVSKNTFDIVHDKGTWDAISLSEERQNRLVAYRKVIGELLVDGGHFVIVSCNFTVDELRVFFGVAPLVFVKQLEPPSAAGNTFSFGGKTGAPYSGALFVKEPLNTH